MEIDVNNSERGVTLPGDVTPAQYGLFIGSLTAVKKYTVLAMCPHYEGVEIPSFAEMSDHCFVLPNMEPDGEKLLFLASVNDEELIRIDFDGTISVRGKVVARVDEEPTDG